MLGRTWIVFAIVLAATSQLAAQTERGPWTIGVDFGSADLDGNVADDYGGVIAFRGGYHLLGNFELEGELRSAVADAGPFDVVLASLMVNGVLCFRADDNVVPYVLVGVGRANLEFDFGGIAIDDDGSAHQVAAGLRWHVGPARRHAVRIEAVYLSENTFDRRSEHTMLTVGWMWRLGSSG